MYASHPQISFRCTNHALMFLENWMKKLLKRKKEEKWYGEMKGILGSQCIVWSNIKKRISEDYYIFILDDYDL